MLEPLRTFFAAPARQALGWAALGILGIAFAAIGVTLILGGDNGAARQAASGTSPTATRTPADASATATASISASTSPIATATSVPTSTATAPPTATVAAAPGGGGGSSSPAPALPTPTPEPADEPAPAATPLPAVAAGGPYCPTITSSAPPNSIFGLLRLGGADAPAGTAVTLLFDGVAGPTALTTAAGGYKVNWAAGGAECANRQGAAIAISVNGAVYASGASIGGGSPALRFDIIVP